MKFLLAIAYLLSALTLPFVVTVVLAIFYLAEGGSILLAVFGGVLVDLVFGAPVAAVHGFSYLSALLMLVLGAATLYLRQALLE